MDLSGGTSKRWQLEPDVKLSEKAKKDGVLVNSQKPFAEQRYWDPANQMYMTPGRKGCQDEENGEVFTVAQAYQNNGQIPSNQIPDRMTVTVSTAFIPSLVCLLADFLRFVNWLGRKIFGS